MSKARTENRQRWGRHVRLSRQYEGGLSSYCRSAGITAQALNYWRKKLSAGEPRISQVSERSPFVAVEVMAPESLGERKLAELPDAQWVADVLRHLSAGLPRDAR